MAWVYKWKVVVQFVISLINQQMSKNCIQKHGEEYEILSLYTLTSNWVRNSYGKCQSK